MTYFKYVLVLLCLLGGTSIKGQEKKPMTFDEMVAWQRITDQQISEDGKWIVCKMEPWEGAATLCLYNEKGKELNRFSPISRSEFSNSSHFLLLTNTPSKTAIDSLKLKKTAKDKMPLNQLQIYS